MNNDNIDNDNDDLENESALPESDGDGTDRRPIGYWLRVVDGLISREFAAAFDAEGVSRRDWMLLNVLSGDVDAPGLAERLARKGKRLRGLEDRGWVSETDGTWTLTDEGRAAKERLGTIVGELRARVAGAVSPEDFATTMASLEAIARELGWDEATARDFGRRGFGRPGWGRRQVGGRGFGFGPQAGFGPFPMHPNYRDGFGPNLHRGFPSPWGPGHGPNGHREPGAHADGEHAGRHDGHGGHGRRGSGHGDAHHGHHCGHGNGAHGGHRGRDEHGHGGHRRPGPHAEQAYERGFDAGFARGREQRDA